MKSWVVSRLVSADVCVLQCSAFHPLGAYIMAFITTLGTIGRPIPKDKRNNAEENEDDRHTDLHKERVIKQSVCHCKDVSLRIMTPYHTPDFLFICTHSFIKDLSLKEMLTISCPVGNGIFEMLTITDIHGTNHNFLRLIYICRNTLNHNITQKMFSTWPHTKLRPRDEIYNSNFFTVMENCTSKLTCCSWVHVTYV